MNVENRFLLMLTALLIALICAFPSALLIVVLTPVFFIEYFKLSGYLCLAATLTFAYNAAKLVKDLHNRYKSQGK